MKPKIALLIFITVALSGCTAQSKVATTTPEYFELARQEFSGDVAYETTAFVEQFWRVAGNTGFNLTVERIASHLETVGYVLESKAAADDMLTYRIEKRTMEQETWEPVDARLSILGSNEALLDYATNRNMIFKNSGSTPAEGVIAELVHLENKEDLETLDFKDKIVFAEMSPNQLYKKVIVEGGALGLVTYNNPKYLQAEKNTTSIQFRSLPYSKTLKSWGIALSYKAKEKLKKVLEEGPVKLKAEISTKFYPSEELTIIDDIKGSELPKESLVFSAHIQEPGANDNASGVGAQLEMAMLSAKLIEAKKLKLKRTLTFLWGDEIVSTRRYIEEKDKRSANINWGISLDMVGENTALTGGSFLIEKMPDPSAIWTRGNDKHSEWGGRPLTLEEMKPHYFNDFIIEMFKTQGAFANWEVNNNPFEGGSDHTPFLKADIPGLLLWHFTDQFYHTDNDRIDKVSKETLKNVGIAALASAYTLVNGDETTALQIKDLVVQAATTRLKAESVLSKAAIADGQSLVDETQILLSWKQWYVDALASTRDLMPTPNAIVNEEIAEAQRALEKLTEDLVATLNN